MKKIILGLAVFYVLLFIQLGFVQYDNQLISKTHEINHVTNQLVEANNKLELIQSNYYDLLETVGFSRSASDIEESFPTPTPLPTETIILPTPTPIELSIQKYSAEDLLWLSRIITKEAGGESVEQQMAVGQVVLNRSEKYDMTIKETVFEYNVLDSGKKSYVFSPAAYKAFKTCIPFDKCIAIAKDLLSGNIYKPVGSALFFCTSGVYKPGGFHYDCSIGSKRHTIKETLRLRNKDGSYTIFFRLL